MNTNLKSEHKEINMTTFINQAAQGDFLITKIDQLPKDLVIQRPENGNFTIAHSETGHNHVIAEDDVEFFHANDNEFVAYLRVNKTADIIHMRGHDTHKPITVNPGIYRINRQREYTPEGYRRAAD